MEKLDLTRCRIIGKTRMDFEVFKSNVCHMVKFDGDLDFIVEMLRSNIIRKYWEEGHYPESFYLLGMLDYLSRIHELPLYAGYDDIRTYSLEDVYYPLDFELIAKINPVLDVREKEKEDAIPEFLRFNIVEKEIRNVC